MKNRKNRSVRTIRIAALVAALCGTNMSLYAGDHVKLNKIVRGRAYISQDGSITTIRVGKKTILNYDRFDIPAGTTLRFVQPGRNSRVLNRITGGTPSSIDGTLAANGIVYIVNPSGVMFGPNSTINVGGLYAAAGSISDADFLRGVNHFTDVHGSVTNQGVIQAQQFAHLIGDSVTNAGAIHAPNGLISLSSGSDVYLAERGRSVMVRVTDPASAGADAGTAGQPAIDNSGVIESGGATFTVGDVYSLAMRNTGSIRADGGAVTVRANGDVTSTGSIQAHSGSVHIDAGRGTASLSGTVDVSGRQPGASGGSVEVTGRTVELRGATVDASGDMGGGRVLLGGGLQGAGELAHADYTSVDAGSTVRADAITAGDGGMIVAWSDQVTSVRGDVSARGGRLVGDGGVIETSSKLMLDVAVTPDVSAVSGLGGMWLIDPNNIEIVAGAGAVNVTGADPFTSLDDTAQLGVDLIYGALIGGANVVVITDTAGADTELGDITLSVPLDLSLTTGSNSLTFNAHNDIHINGAIGNGGAQVLNLNLIAGETINLNAAVDLNGGDFSSLSNEFNLNDLLTANNITIVQNNPALRGLRIAGSKLATQLSLTPGEIAMMNAGGVLTLGDATGIVARVFDDVDFGANDTVIRGAAVRIDGNITGSASLTLAAGASGIILADADASADDMNVAGVTFDGAVTLADDVDYRVDAGGGPVTFTSTVEGFNLGAGDESLTVANGGVTGVAGLISGSGGAAGTDALTDVTFQNVGQTTLSGVTIAGAFDLTGAAGLNTMAAPVTAGTSTINVAGAAQTNAFNVGTLDLTAGSLTAMQRYNVGAMTINSGLTLLIQGFDATGSVQINNTGTFALSGAASTAGDFSASGAGAAVSNLASGITTTGGAISFQGQNVNIAAPVTLSTTSGAPGGADITLGGNVSLGNNLTLDAGTGGAVAFNGSVGVPGAAGNLTILNSATVAGSTINARIVDMLAQTSISLGNVTTTNAGGVVLTAPTLTLGNITTTGNGVVTLNVNGGSLAVNNILADGAITQTGAFGVALNGTIYRTSGDTISFAGPITLGADALIATTNGAANGADITLAQGVDMAGFDLTLDAGLTGNIPFGAGADITNGGDLLIQQANDVTLQNVTVNSLTQADGQGLTTLAGAVTAGGANGAGNAVDITTTDLEIQAPVTAAGGNVAIASADDIGIEDAGITFNLTNAELAFIESENIAVTSTGGLIVIASDNAVTQDEENYAFNASGPIVLNGDVSTAGSTASLDGALDFQTATEVGAGLVTLDTTDGAITFGAGINSTGGPNSLVLEAGTAAIQVNGAVGSVARLDQLTATGGTIDVQDVRTTGAQTYTATTVNANGTTIDIDGTGTLDGAGNAFVVNGDLAMTQNGSSVNADAGHIRVNGAATGQDDASLTATGAAADVRITGAASFQDRLTVEADRSVTFGSTLRIGDDAQVTANTASVIFNGDVDAQAGDTGSLTVTAAAGNVDFVGDVGQADALSSLTSTALTTQVRNVRTTGNQQYNSNLTVEGDNVSSSTVLSTTGDIEVTGMTVAANETAIDPAIGVVIEATNGQVHLVGMVDGATLDQNVLTINGDTVVLDSNVGFALLPRLACLTINANAASVQSVFTRGAQDYSNVGMLTVNGGALQSFGNSIVCPVGGLTFNNIILAGNTNIISGGAAGDDITVNGAINGPFQLAMFANDADVLLCGTIGGVNALAAFGAFGENVTIFDVGTPASTGVTGALTVTAGTDINFKGNTYRANNQIWTAGNLFNQELAGGARSFTADAGNIFFAGLGSTILRDGLAMNVNSVAGDVVFQGRIFGDMTTAASETLNLVAFDRIDLFGNVGDNATDGFLVPVAEAGRLGVLSANAGNVTRIQDVRTTGVQVYNVTTGGTLLIEGSRLDASAASITVGSLLMPAPTLLANNVTVTTGGLAGQDVIFNGTIDSDGVANRALVVNSGAADIFFGNDIGRAGGLALSRLTSLDASGRRITLGGDVIVTGFVLINGASILNDLDDDRVIVLSDGGAITFNGTIDAPGADGLEVVSSGGTVNLNGDAGATNALAFLHADVNGGQVNLGGDVLTNGTAIGVGADAVFHGETVRVDGATFLTDGDGRVLMQAGGGDVAFTSTIDSFANAGLELLSAGGDATFGGDIGAVSPLAFLGVDVDAGAVTFNGDIATSGGAILGNNLHTETVRVDGLVQLADGDGRVVVQGGGGDVTFTSSVDSLIGNGLEVVSDGGDATFGGDLGSFNALAFVNIDTNGASAGSVNLGGDITTSGAEIGNGADGEAHTESVRVDGATTLTSDVTVTSADGNVLFNDTIDGATALVVDAGAGEATFQGAIGDGDELASLEATASRINVNGGSVSTSGDQAWNGATVLGADTVMNGANVAFNGTLDSDGVARDLTLNVNGVTSFGDDVGDDSALADLVTDGAGTSTFAGDVTAANMTFNDNATTSVDVTFNGSGSVVFNDTLNGAGNNVTVNSPATTFNGRVTNMDTLTTDADGTTFIGTDLVAGESLLFNDHVVLATNIPGNAVSFDGDTTVAFGQTVSGSMINDMTVTSPLTVFTGIVFGVDDLLVDGLARVNSDVNARTIRFLDTVQLTGNSVMGDITSVQAGLVANQSVIFEGQVQGGMLGGGDRTDLTVNSPATFFNAGTAGLGRLMTDAAGQTTIDDDIETFEGAVFGDAVRITDSLTIADRGQGNVLFLGTLDSIGGAHDLVLQVAPDAAFDLANPAAPFIGFNGNVGSAGAFNLLKLGADFAAIPPVATLVAGPLNADGTIAEADIADYAIEFNAATIDMGVHQKLSVFGDVVINGSQLAILSDIGALGSLDVNAPSIQVRSRERGRFVVLRNGAFLEGTDFGTDFVADDLDFSSRPRKLGGTGRSDATFAVFNPRNLSQTLDQSNIRLLTSNPAFGDLFATSEGNTPRSAFLDVAANGPLAGNLADLQGTAALEQQADDGEVTAGATAPLTVLDTLRRLNLPVAAAGTNVLIDARSGGYASYDNSPFIENEAELGMITINRVPENPVLSFIDQIESLIEPAGELYRGRSEFQLELVRRFDEFMIAVGGETENLGEEFRTYLSVVGRDPQAEGSLYEQLSRIGGALDDIERMYLSSSETEKALERVTERLWAGADAVIEEEFDVARTDEVMSLEQFREVLEAFRDRPERMVDAQPLDPADPVIDDASDPGLEEDGAAE